MRKPIPLLLMLRESEEEGDTPREALVKLMCIILGRLTPKSADCAEDWHERNGEPTYAKLREWCYVAWRSKWFRKFKAPLIHKHLIVLATMDTADRERMLAWTLAIDPDAIPDGQGGAEAS